jgi:IS5 family transposase
MVPRVQHVIQQAQQRVFGGNTHAAQKLVSLFEPTTEIIRKGKTSKPTEFGKMLKMQEAENQIITDYAVYEKRPSDSDLVLPALEAHQQKLGRTPHLLAGDAVFYSAKNEAATIEKGVKRVCLPNRSTKSAEGSDNRRNAGSATGRNGGLDARDVSVS